MALRQGQRTDHLRFDWQHDAQSDRLTLSTPLGQGMARLVREPGAARLTLADGKEMTAANWQLLAAQVLHGEVPLDELPEWLRGARPALQGRTGAWQVTVSEVETVAGSEVTGAACHRVPRILDIEGEAVGLRLVVDDRGP